MSARTMRAAVLVAPRRVELRELPLPHPGPTGLLVELEGCGLCGSNLPVWQGRGGFDYPPPAGAPGHEGWGRVVARGAGTHTPIGTRVAWLSGSALAEYDLAEEAESVPLPPELDDADFPGEAFGCAWNAFGRSGVVRGERVAVVGCGFFGACLMRLAAFCGARVLAISRRETSLRFARELGAEEARRWSTTARILHVSCRI